MLESVDITKSYNHDVVHSNFWNEVLSMKEILLKDYWQCTERCKSKWILEATC
jgi:hypothetical protein